MKLARSLRLNRISGQMAILILVSLLAIHVFITATIFLTHRLDGPRGPDDRPSELAAMLKLIAATVPADRARLLSDASRTVSYTHLTLPTIYSV